MSIDTSELKAPEGFVIDRIGTCTSADKYYLSVDGTPGRIIGTGNEMHGLVILKKQFTPEPGDVIEVTDNGYSQWTSRIFVGMAQSGMYLCIDVSEDGEYKLDTSPKTCPWDQARPAVPTEVIKATLNPEHKLFEITWDDHPRIEGRPLKTGLCLDDYRIFGYDDNPNFVINHEFCAISAGEYETESCDHTGNRKYAIGRYEG